MLKSFRSLSVWVGRVFASANRSKASASSHFCDADSVAHHGQMNFLSCSLQRKQLRSNGMAWRTVMFEAQPCTDEKKARKPLLSCGLVRPLFQGRLRAVSSVAILFRIGFFLLGTASCRMVRHWTSCSLYPAGNLLRNTHIAILHKAYGADTAAVVGVQSSRAPMQEFHTRG